MKKRVGIIASLSLTALLCVFAIGNSAHAELIPDNERVTQFNTTQTAQNIVSKSYYQALYQCYGSTYKDGKKTDIAVEINQYDGHTGLFPKKGDKKSYFPTGLTPAEGDNTTCKSFANGGSGFENSVYERIGQGSKISGTDLSGFYAGMGYTQTDGGPDGIEAQLTIQIKWKFAAYVDGVAPDSPSIKTVDYELRTNKVNIERVGDNLASAHLGGVSVDSSYQVRCKSAASDCSALGGSTSWHAPLQGEPYAYFAYIDGDSMLSVGFDVAGYELNDGAHATGLLSDVMYYHAGSKVWDNFYVNTVDVQSFEAFEEALTNAANNLEGISYGYDNSEWWNDPYSRLQMCDMYGDNCRGAYTFKIVPSADYPQMEVEENGHNFLDTWQLNVNEGATPENWSSSGWETPAAQALQYLGNKTYPNQKLNNSEIIMLYQSYIQDVGHAYVYCSEEEKSSHPDATTSIRWFNGTSSPQTCNTSIASTSTKVVAVNSDGTFGYFATLADIVNMLNNNFGAVTTLNSNDVTALDSRTVNQALDSQIVAPIGDPGSGDGTGADADCYTNAGSLGWVVCPIIYNLGDFIKENYQNWVEPALQINTNLFGSDGSHDTYDVWNIFRNIANVAFVIVFLVVIFSQLTGVGLDNYGIKKILPKLIIGAILINLSYVICQLAIDVANIVGYSIGGVFKGISSGIGVPGAIEVQGASVAPSEVGWLEGGGGLGLVVTLVIGVVTAAAVISQGTAIIVPVLLAVIGIAISLFTLIAILGMRQAAAVLLVVASPLAFICYMLPNTKKIFEKWFTVMKGLLIAFPACSALIYGGDMVGRILIKTGNGSTWVIISAAIVSVAPVFFIPKLIKSSMGAVSNVASRLTGGLNKGIGRAVNGSQIAKNIRANHENRKQFSNAMRRSGLKFDEDGNVVGRTLRGRMQDALPRTKAGRSMIARNRAAATKEQIEAASAGLMMGEAGVRHAQASIDANRARLENQDVQDAWATMTNEIDEETGSYKYRTLDAQQEAFRTYMTQGVHSDEDRLRLKALATHLSASGAGQKFMAGVLRGVQYNEQGRRIGGEEVNTDALRTLANYASNSGNDLIQKIANKDASAANYLEAMSSAGEGGIKQYASAEGGEKGWSTSMKSGTNLTNAQFVANDVLDKNNLFSQGGTAFKEAISAYTEDENGSRSYMVSAERLERALTDPNLDLKDSQRAEIKAQLEQRKEYDQRLELSGDAHDQAMARAQEAQSTPVPAQAPAASSTTPARTVQAQAPTQASTQAESRITAARAQTEAQVQAEVQAGIAQAQSSQSAQTAAPRETTGLGPRARREQAIQKAQDLLNSNIGPRARREAEETIKQNDLNIDHEA